MKNIEKLIKGYEEKIESLEASSKSFRERAERLRASWGSDFWNDGKEGLFGQELLHNKMEITVYRAMILDLQDAR